MKKKDTALWAAIRLHRILIHRRPPTDPIPSLSTLLHEQKAVERGWRMYQKAVSRGWSHTAGILFRRLETDIASVNTASRIIRPSRICDAPAIGDILAEIRQLHDEFDDVEIDPKKKRIHVTTDAISLEEVSLGAFSIQLHFDRLSKRKDSSAFAIVAEDANAASGDSTCTHPHVRDESLCAGEATAPISNALAEGRIGEAFQLINRVLHTYNPSSAYVSLSDWDGRTCSDCDRTISPDDLYFCNCCDHDFCDNCICTCQRCDQSICLECSEETDDGDRLCPTCKSTYDQEQEESDEEEEQAAAVSDDPTDDSIEDEPQPPTETIHEHSHSPAIPAIEGAELPGGTPAELGTALPTSVPAPQAA